MTITQAKGHIAAFLTEQDGVTAIEYALLGALIAVAIAATVGSLGGALLDLYKKVEAILP